MEDMIVCDGDCGGPPGGARDHKREFDETGEDVSRYVEMVGNLGPSAHDIVNGSDG